MTRGEIHERLRANAAHRDRLREAIHAAIRAGQPAPPEAAEMRAVLADDERLRPLHARVCRDVRECSL